MKVLHPLSLSSLIIALPFLPFFLIFDPSFSLFPNLEPATPPYTASLYFQCCGTG